MTAGITKVQKWGNSQGLRLSKNLLRDADIEVGDPVDVVVHDGTLIVTPLRRLRGKLDLGQLVQEIPADYKPGELDWGPPTGREVWQVAAYVPRRGDLVAITFDPQSGHEQRDRRPALVVSNDLFNKHAGVCIVSPVTNTRRDYPFHVTIPEGQKVTGVVMVEQIKSIGFHSRDVKRIGSAPEPVLQEVLSILDACIY